MAQIININIGKVGVRIGEQFINKIAHEHFSEDNQKKGKSYVFFHEKQKVQQSRSIFIDLDSRVIDKVHLQNKTHTIKQKNIIKDSTVHSDVYAKYGYLNESEITNQSIESIRLQVEACDSISGFVVLNSLGSCSAGLNTQILGYVRQSFPSISIQTHNLIADIESSCSPIQVYNSALSIVNILELSSMTILSQNQACINRLQCQGNLRPTIEQMNDALAQSICETTAPYRFGGSLNTSQRKILTNLILFPRMKFLSSSFYNRSNRLSHIQCALKPQSNFTANLFKNKHGVSDIYTMSVHCRDNFAYQQQINEIVKSWLHTNQIVPCEWIQNYIQTSISDQVNERPSSSILLNSRCISKVIQKLSLTFTSLNRRKAFTSHFRLGGLDQMQLTQAESNLNDLISQYDYQQPYSESSYFQ